MGPRTVASEFAAVDVDVDQHANGPRLRIEDLKTGRVGYLDPLELETLAWLPEGALHPLLDPSALRWREESTVVRIDELVRQLYAALRAGDAEGVEALLTDDFEAELAEAMPLGLGGRPRGAREMREHWWAIGRAFQVHVEPSDWIPCAGGRLLVIGNYVGTARSSGNAFEAAFAHLWGAREGLLASVRQLTDTAAWAAALE